MNQVELVLHLLLAGPELGDVGVVALLLRLVAALQYRVLLQAAPHHSSTTNLAIRLTHLATRSSLMTQQRPLSGSGWQAEKSTPPLGVKVR